MRIGTRLKFSSLFAICLSLTSVGFFILLKSAFKAPSETPDGALLILVDEFEKGRFSEAFLGFKSKSSEPHVSKENLGSIAAAYYREIGVSPRLSLEAMDYNDQSKTRKDYRLVYKNYPAEQPIFVTMAKDADGEWVTNFDILITFLINLQVSKDPKRGRLALAKALRKLDIDKLYRDEARYTTPERLEAFANGKIPFNRIYTRNHLENPF